MSLAEALAVLAVVEGHRQYAVNTVSLVDACEMARRSVAEYDEALGVVWAWLCGGHREEEEAGPGEGATQADGGGTSS